MTRHHTDKHNREYRIGADAVTWQLLHMDAAQLRAALLYISALDEEAFAKAVLAGRGIGPAPDPVSYVAWEAHAGETYEREQAARAH